MFWSAGFLAGIILGSFVKVLADRSLVFKSFWGRSYCPECRHKLAWYDLLPIVSYILLHQRCRYCRRKIPLEYPLTEIVMGILVAYLFLLTFRDFQIPANIFEFGFVNLLFDLLFKIFFIAVLFALLLTDIKKMLIPDRIILPAIIIGFSAFFAVTVYKIGYLYYYLSGNSIGKYLLPPYNDYFARHALQTAEPLIYGILTGLAAGGFFYALIIITRGKGMGGGDVKLGAFMGLVLGFPNTLLALVLSFITGAVFSVALIVLRKKHFGEVIPFGPFLVLGSLIALFWGSRIIEWYLHLGT